MRKALESLLDKLAVFEREVSEEMGDFSLFGLFRRDDAISWDLVVTAPWIDRDRAAALKLLAGRLQSRLSTPELQELSAVFPLTQDHPVRSVVKQELPRAEHDRLALGGFETDHQSFDKSYLITNK